MTYDLDAVIAEDERKPFVFTLKGEQWTLPHAETISAEQAEALDAGHVVKTLKSIGGNDLGAQLAKLPAFALEALMNEWLKASGTTLGEELASTGS